MYLFAINDESANLLLSIIVTDHLEARHGSLCNSIEKGCFVCVKSWP